MDDLYGTGIIENFDTKETKELVVDGYKWLLSFTRVGDLLSYDLDLDESSFFREQEIKKRSPKEKVYILFTVAVSSNQKKIKRIDDVHIFQPKEKVSKSGMPNFVRASNTNLSIAYQFHLLSRDMMELSASASINSDYRRQLLPSYRAQIESLIKKRIQTLEKLLAGTKDTEFSLKKLKTSLQKVDENERMSATLIPLIEIAKLLVSEEGNEEDEDFEIQKVPPLLVFQYVHLASITMEGVHVEGDNISLLITDFAKFTEVKDEVGGYDAEESRIINMARKLFRLLLVMRCHRRFYNEAKVLERMIAQESKLENAKEQAKQSRSQKKKEKKKRKEAEEERQRKIKEADEERQRKEAEEERQRKIKEADEERQRKIKEADEERRKIKEADEERQRKSKEAEEERQRKIKEAEEKQRKKAEENQEKIEAKTLNEIDEEVSDTRRKFEEWKHDEEKRLKAEEERLKAEAERCDQRRRVVTDKLKSLIVKTSNRGLELDKREAELKWKEDELKRKEEAMNQKEADLQRWSAQLELDGEELAQRLNTVIIREAIVEGEYKKIGLQCTET